MSVGVAVGRPWIMNGPTGNHAIDGLIAAAACLTALAVIGGFLVRWSRALWRDLLLPVGRAADAIVSIVPTVKSVSEQIDTLQAIPDFVEYVHDFKHRTLNELTRLTLPNEVLLEMAKRIGDAVADLREVATDLRMAAAALETAANLHRSTDDD